MRSDAALLRIRIVLGAEALNCEWALLEKDLAVTAGEGALTDLPVHHGRTELILSAGDVMITRLALPDNARSQGDALLAYAVEDVTAGDPQANQVSWLGADGAGLHTLAVLDKLALERWRSALTAANIRSFELRYETLQLPWSESTWSIAWNGVDGFVRTAHDNGWVTDCGDDQTPPLSLALAQPPPTSVTLYSTVPGAKPDLSAWSKQMGVPVNYGGDWNWTLPVTGAGPALSHQRQRWGFFKGLLPRLRPALWLVVFALLVQGVAVFLDQIRLESEQRELRAQMEQRFRSVFPDAVAVIDPALQMNRQLTRFRQLNGIADNSDFLPMLQQLAQATRELPAGLLRSVSWESGRMTVEFVGLSEPDGQRIQARLIQAVLRVEGTPGSPALVLIVSAV